MFASATASPDCMVGPVLVAMVVVDIVGAVLVPVVVDAAPPLLTELEAVDEPVSIAERGLNRRFGVLEAGVEEAAGVTGWSGVSGVVDASVLDATVLALVDEATLLSLTLGVLLPMAGLEEAAVLPVLVLVAVPAPSAYTPVRP